MANLFGVFAKYRDIIYLANVRSIAKTYTQTTWNF